MKQKFVYFALVLMLIINCSACGKTTYDFDKMADNLLTDAYGNEIGSIDVNGCAFTLDDLQPYRTIDQNTLENPEKYNDKSVDEPLNESYGHIDVETAIMNTNGILNNYLDGHNVRFDTESLLVMAKNIDEVMASDLTDEKPISIINDGYVVEVEYDNAVIYWGLGAEADQINVIEK